MGIVVLLPILAACNGDNLAPIAVVGDSTAVQGEYAAVSGESSQDPEGRSLDFEWTLRRVPPLSHTVLDEPAASTATFYADRAGTYVLDLVVSDGRLDSEPGTAVVEVFATGDAPVADAGPDRDVLVDTVVVASAVASSNPNGFPLIYDWVMVETPSGSQAELDDPFAEAVSFQADAEGDYRLQLQVHNGSLASDVDEVVFTALVGVDYVTGDVPNGVFDAGEVYLAGTLSEGACYRDAIAHWAEPDTAAVGFDCYFSNDDAVVRADGTLLYTNTFEDILREFHCDDCPGWEPGDTYPATSTAWATSCTPRTTIRPSRCTSRRWSPGRRQALRHGGQRLVAVRAVPLARPEVPQQRGHAGRLR